MSPETRQQIIDFYLEGFSPQLIFEKLSSEGVELSIGKIIYALRKANVIRKRSSDRKRENFFREKSCVFCKVVFVPKGSTHKYCKTCVSTHQQCMRANNFGISQPEYAQMLIEQNNACALCERSFENLSNLQIYIDHCHTNEQVRGILCARCNTFLMVVDAHDFESWFEKATNYIKRPGLLPVWKRNEK